MKKLLAFILLAAMLVSVTACGSKNDEKVMGVYTADTNTYENDFIGIGCKLDSDWEVFSTEQIAQLNGLMASQMTDEALAKQLEDSGVLQPFYAQKEEGLVTMNIALENLGVLYGSTMDEQQYAEQAVKQVAPTLESLGLGMTNIKTEIGKLTFAGKEHVAIFVSANIQGFSFYETMVCIKTGRYIANITAGSYFTDTTKDSLALFYGL